MAERMPQGIRVSRYTNRPSQHSNKPSQYSNEQSQYSNKPSPRMCRTCEMKSVRPTEYRNGKCDVCGIIEGKAKEIERIGAILSQAHFNVNKYVDDIVRLAGEIKTLNDKRTKRGSEKDAYVYTPSSDDDDDDNDDDVFEEDASVFTSFSDDCTTRTLRDKWPLRPDLDMPRNRWNGRKGALGRNSTTAVPKRGARGRRVDLPAFDDDYTPRILRDKLPPRPDLGMPGNRWNGGKGTLGKESTTAVPESGTRGRRMSPFSFGDEYTPRIRRDGWRPGPPDWDMPRNRWNGRRGSLGEEFTVDVPLRRVRGQRMDLPSFERTGILRDESTPRPGLYMSRGGLNGRGGVPWDEPISAAPVRGGGGRQMDLPSSNPNRRTGIWRDESPPRLDFDIPRNRLNGRRGVLREKSTTAVPRRGAREREM